MNDCIFIAKIMLCKNCCSFIFFSFLLWVFCKSQRNPQANSLLLASSLADVPLGMQTQNVDSFWAFSKISNRGGAALSSSGGCKVTGVLINHTAVIPFWQLKLTSTWMGKNKRPSSGPFLDTFIQSRSDCLRQQQQLFCLHLSPFDKVCQVIFL